MAELQAICRINNVLTASDMFAAQQLMQLSDDDNYSNSNSNNNRISKNRNHMSKNDKKVIIHDDEDEEFDRRSQDEITSKKIEEIFGKEEELEQEVRPKKKRFRTIQNIYQTTRPIKIKYT